MSDRPYSWESNCPKREDKTHCTCWYDGGKCCACGDPPAQRNGDGTPAGISRGPHPQHG